MPPDNVTKARVLIAAVVLCIGATLTWLAWEKGRHSVAIPPKNVFSVVGGSMAPSLLGLHQMTRCSTCELMFPSRASEHKILSRCWHCGQQTLGSLSQPVSGQLVRIVTLTEQVSIRRGDCVAIESPDSTQDLPRVKRVVGLPGETISTDNQRLFVDGVEVTELLVGQSREFPLAIGLVPVDLDHHRKESRWRSDGLIGDGLIGDGLIGDGLIGDGLVGNGWVGQWQRDPQSRVWEFKSSASSPPDDSGWLIYHHRNVYANNQPAAIQDDYPFNLGFKRRLYAVKRLELTCNVVRVGSKPRMQVAFWHPNGTRVVGFDHVKTGELTARSVDAVSDSSLQLAPEMPVAISASDGIAIDHLRLKRMVDYRLRRSDSLANYPMTLKADEYFVLGDNVPISDDSRRLGPISDKQIIGTVIRFSDRQ